MRCMASGESSRLGEVSMRCLRVWVRCSDATWRFKPRVKFHDGFAEALKTVPPLRSTRNGVFVRRSFLIRLDLLRADEVAARRKLLAGGSFRRCMKPVLFKLQNRFLTSKAATENRYRCALFLHAQNKNGRPPNATSHLRIEEQHRAITSPFLICRAARAH